MKDALHSAAADVKTGYLKVRSLVENEKVDVNTPHSVHKTKAVDFAAQQGSLDTLRYLLEEAKADIDASQSSYNLLYWAIGNKPEVIQYIIDPRSQLIPRFNDGTTDLHVAAMVDDFDEIDKLLTKDPDSIEKKTLEVRQHYIGPLG